MNNDSQSDNDCLKCHGDPAVCASVPGLRHCERAMRESVSPAPSNRVISVDVMDGDCLRVNYFDNTWELFDQNPATRWLVQAFEIEKAANMDKAPVSERGTSGAEPAPAAAGLVERLRARSKMLRQGYDEFDRFAAADLDDQAATALSSRRVGEDYKALYMELLYAVARKWPDETRHQTALRYIRERENMPSNPAQASQRLSGDANGR